MLGHPWQNSRVPSLQAESSAFYEGDPTATCAGDISAPALLDPNALGVSPHNGCTSVHSDVGPSRESDQSFTHQLDWV